MIDMGETINGKEIGYPYSHKRIWRACIDCGRQRWVREQRGKPRNPRCHSCANKLRHIRAKGLDANHWKGGRNKIRTGYIEILVLPDDFFYPMAQKSRRYVLEHRLVMAKYLNRCLLPWETVHHKNGIKDDNRIENLELLPKQGKHNTFLNKEVKRQTNLIKQLEARVTLLEAENVELRCSMSTLVPT